MRVLVIDDYRANQKSAEALAIEHQVTVVGEMQEAYEILQEREFDAVLTDLYMPIGRYVGAMPSQHDDRAKEVPAGLVFAIKAVNKGARVVICSDANHHQEWLCSLLDLVSHVYHRGTPHMNGDPGQKIAFLEARKVSIRGYWDEKGRQIVVTDQYLQGERIIKDWGEVLRRSGIFPEAEG